MVQLENFKSKINDKHKLIFGVIGVMAGIIFLELKIILYW